MYVCYYIYAVIVHVLFPRTSTILIVGIPYIVLLCYQWVWHNGVFCCIQLHSVFVFTVHSTMYLPEKTQSMLWRTCP